ncbi:MAG: hypothetical protein ABW245_07910 [Gaiellaceae bacterium]
MRRPTTASAPSPSGTRRSFGSSARTNHALTARRVAIATTYLYFDLRVVKQRVAETEEADEVLPVEAPPAVARQ